MPALIENYSDQIMKHDSKNIIEGMDHSGPSASNNNSDDTTTENTAPASAPATSGTAPHGPPPNTNTKTGSFSTQGATIYFFMFCDEYMAFSVSSFYYLPFCLVWSFFL